MHNEEVNDASTSTNWTLTYLFFSSITRCMRGEPDFGYIEHGDAEVIG